MNAALVQFQCGKRRTSAALNPLRAVSEHFDITKHENVPNCDLLKVLKKTNQRVKKKKNTVNLILNTIERGNC